MLVIMKLIFLHGNDESNALYMSIPYTPVSYSSIMDQSLDNEGSLCLTAGHSLVRHTHLTICGHCLKRWSHAMDPGEIKQQELFN